MLTTATQHNQNDDEPSEPVAAGIITGDILADDDSAIPEPVIVPELTFAEIGVRPETVEALETLGIRAPFAIQTLAIPLGLEGTDLIGQARTGTGKTLAFGIPLLQRILGPAEGADGRPQALVIVPTRELCVQVTEDLRKAGVRRSIRLLSVYGGRAYEPQVEALKSGVDIVVGTPGRLLDLARQRMMKLDGVRALVLDEADEMLDLGFLPDVERILEFVPTDRQTMLFSATMPGPVVALARRFMRRPVHVRAEQPDENRTVPNTSQHIYRAHALDKVEMLARILQADSRGLAMVFTRTKRTADKVAEDLKTRGFAAAAVHGDLGQGAREQALRAFRAGKIDVLVATDVAARGIDVTGVTHVINYQCPEDEKVYLHRIGRTGRAGGDGVAVTFVDWDDLARWGMVNTALSLPFASPPETYSSSPHLYAELGIPEGSTGVLPRAQRTRAGLGAEAVEDIGETGRKRSPAGRSSSRDSARPSGGRGRDHDTPRPEQSDEPRPGRTRERRRTRGAGPALAAADPAVVAASDAPVTEISHGAEIHGPESADGEATKRRRRRGGRGRRRTNADGTVSESTDSPAEDSGQEAESA